MISLRPRWALAGLFCLFAGCGVYLHDDDLQTQTAKALDDYKSADVAGSLKVAIDGQSQIDKIDIDTLLNNEAANRDLAVVDIISSYPKTDFAIDRLIKRINARISELAGGAMIIDSEWFEFSFNRVEVKTADDVLNRQYLAKVRAFKAAGGKGFTSCKEFGGPEGQPASAQDAARKLFAQCQIIAASSEPLIEFQRVIDKVRNADPPGEIARIDAELVEAEAQIEAVKASRAKVLADLAEARNRLKKDGKDPTAIDDEVRGLLKNLDAKLQEADKAAGFIGGKNFSLGAALAVIEFRKTNLRDVIAAGGEATGATNADAAAVSRSIVGMVAGLIKLRDAENGTAPTVPALSVALAFQDGLAKAAQVQLDTLTQKVALLQDQEDALLRELEFLVVARVAASDAHAAMVTHGCAPKGLGEVFLLSECSTSRASAAHALSAYNLSWASGRTAARIDGRRLDHLIVWEKLRVSQEAAIARANIQTTALTELKAFGEGGVKPETIAAFIQAFGVVAIAAGM